VCVTLTAYCVGQNNICLMVVANYSSQDLKPHIHLVHTRRCYCMCANVHGSLEVVS